MGLPARAVVRSLADERAILAQGQDNSLRLDPGFIEVSVFVSQPADAARDNGIDLAALADSLGCSAGDLPSDVRFARLIDAAASATVRASNGPPP